MPSVTEMQALEAQKTLDKLLYEFRKMTPDEKNSYLLNVQKSGKSQLYKILLKFNAQIPTLQEQQIRDRALMNRAKYFREKGFTTDEEWDAFNRIINDFKEGKLLNEQKKKVNTYSEALTIAYSRYGRKWNERKYAREAHVSNFL